MAWIGYIMQRHWEEINSLKCKKCGSFLDDNGKCPKCTQEANKDE